VGSGLGTFLGWFGFDKGCSLPHLLIDNIIILYAMCYFQVVVNKEHSVKPHVIPEKAIMALFIWLIIRLIQLVFLAETVFLSHKKPANSVFQPAYNFSRTAPMLSTIWEH
jgi:hypothetical protein